MYRSDNDWILASHHKKGKEPIRLDYAMRKNIRPVAARLGIKARIGWHTFRRSYSSALISSGAGPKIVQELMRHSNVAITMDLYAQAHQEEKRAAQQSLNELFIVPKAS
jgi:integrase